MSRDTIPKTRSPRGSAGYRPQHRGWNVVLSRSILIAVAFHAALLSLGTADVDLTREAIRETPWMALVSVPTDSILELPASTDAVVRPERPAPLAEPLLPPGPLEPTRPVVPEHVPDLSLPEALELPTFVPRTSPDVLRREEVSVRSEWAKYENLTPDMTRPEIRNRDAVERMLRSRYQPILSFTGATGVVTLLFWIDESGSPQRSTVVESSGHLELDRLSRHVSRRIRFVPATREGEPVPVKVLVPFRFVTASGSLGRAM